MRPSRAALALLALCLLAGCAHPLAAPDAGQATAPCLPAAVSSQFFYWPVVGFRAVNLVTEDGEAAPAAWVMYRKGKAAVAALWAQTDLIAVDPSPDSDTAEWVDLSLVVPQNGKLVLRTKPEAPCRWERWEIGTNAFLGPSLTVHQAPSPLSPPRAK